MFGLSVRWSLVDCAPEVPEQLRAYVLQTSLGRFSGMPGLRTKTWRMRSGEWFEGTYVFATAANRTDFLNGFRPGAAIAPGSVIVGAPPVAYETFEVVAVAEGGAGFVDGAGPGAG